MKRIKEFNSQSLDTFIEEFTNCIKVLEEKLGLKIDLGSIGYDKTQLTSKITVFLVKEGVSPEETKYKKSLRDHGFRYNLSEKDYKKELISPSGQKITILGISPRAKKRPIIVGIPQRTGVFVLSKESFEKYTESVYWDKNKTNK